jgi:D-serine deaminase-like pyridoxal phosphate-dependent protein
VCSPKFGPGLICSWTRTIGVLGWPDGVSPFATSLFVRALAISVNRPELAVVNAGIKSFATDSGVPTVARGASAAAHYKFMGDEHGGLVYANPDDARLAVGDAIEFVASHCDPTVNLFDFYHCMRDDVLADIWRIDARGR